MVAQQGFDMSRFAPPLSPPPPFGPPLGAQVYIMSNSIFLLFISHSFFNGTLYVIQFFHTPSGHDGGSSSHQNELTLRDINDHSHHPSDDKQHVSVFDYGDNVWLYVLLKAPVPNCIATRPQVQSFQNIVTSAHTCSRLHMWQNHLRNEGSVFQDPDRVILDEARMHVNTHMKHLKP
jgi:hypothetical protein